MSDNLKLYLVSVFWISWYVLFVVISGGLSSVHSFYYFFLFTLVLYQSPRIFPLIAFVVLAFNLFCFSTLWAWGASEEIIKSYFYSGQVNYESFIIHLVNLLINILNIQPKLYIYYLQT